MSERASVKSERAQFPTETVEFFGGDELRMRCFLDKYALRDVEGQVVEKTPLEMWKRIARELASVEASKEKQREWQKKFYWLLEDFRFIPGGRIMFGAGQPRRATLLNCYVIPIKEDSIESIFEWCKEAARTYSFGGGVGTDISILRPKGAPVNNAAIYSTGSVSFMDLFSMTTGTIGQAGRRGALMITISCDHPDVMEFIEIKNDPSRTKVQFANISVRLTDEFMEAVEKDKPFTLRYENDVIGRFTKKVRAKEVWEKLIQNAHASAEPGLIFWDNVKRESTTEYNGMEVITTNPCSLAGDTYVLTPYGICELQELVERSKMERRWADVIIDKRAADRRGIHTATPSFIGMTGFNELWRVRLSNGMEVLATPDHKFKVLNHQKFDPEHNSYGWKRADELSVGDEIPIFVDRGARKLCFAHRSWELQLDAKALAAKRKDAKVQTLCTIPKEWDLDVAYLLGYCVGDATYNHEKITVYFHEGDADHLSRCVNRVTRKYIGREFPLQKSEGEKSFKINITSAVFRRFLRELGLENATASTKVIPKTILMDAPEEVVAAFVRGLFDADGTIWYSGGGKRKALSVASVSEKLIRQLQLVLLQWGIYSHVGLATKESGEFAYTTKSGKAITYVGRNPVWRLTISNVTCLKTFRKHIGFALPRKAQLLESAISLAEGTSSRPRSPLHSSKVICVEPTRVHAPVYDLTEPSTKSFIANGMVVSNSEIPLEPYGCCCLGNINLARFVKGEFEKGAAVDWQNLEIALRYATRFLDNVLDYNADKHPLRHQKEASLHSRRIGVGFTGFGDMLIKMGLKYDTEAAIEFTDELFERAKNIVYDESTQLAVEKGTFPAFELEKHMRSPFVERLDRRVLTKIKAHGLRNAALLTVPPVGSGSVLAGCTSGIEPIFELSYVRKSKSLSKGEFQVHHPLVQEYMDRFGLKDPKDLPNLFVTAHQIKPEFRVQMQAAIQRHIDHAISSTVNLPRDITPEEVAKIYLLGWKRGCKGITVYREGSREGILITQGEAARKRATITPRPRPQVVKGKTYRMKTEMGNIYVTINEDDKGMVEVFANLGKSGSSGMAFTEAIGRLISLALRSGVKPTAVIDELSLIRGLRPVVQEDGKVVFSVPDAIAKAMEEYLKGGEQLALLEDVKPTQTAKHPEVGTNGHDHKRQAELCPSCGGLLMFTNGCYICSDCGFSECD